MHPRTPARSANGGGHPAPAAELSGIVQALSIRYDNLVYHADILAMPAMRQSSSWQNVTRA